jgi:uncharacterized protein (TIGR02996 family)
MTEDDFLRAIQASPDDTATKLVYADWLEEHGQRARAEILRRWSEGQWPSDSGNQAWADLVSGRVPLWDSPTLLALGHLEGLLNAYSQVNQPRSDLSFEFNPTLVRPVGPLADQVRDYFPAYYHPVSLEKILDWKAVGRETLTRWLFHSLRDLQDGLFRPAFLDERGRADIVDDVMLALEDVIQPRAAWRIRITENRFYEVAWDDFILEADDRRLFLHFSCTD